MERRVLLQGWLGAGGVEGGDGRARSLRRWNGAYSFRAGWAPAEPKATMGGLARRWAHRPDDRADDGGAQRTAKRTWST